MNIEPLAQHVELAPAFQGERATPGAELVVSAAAYDQPYDQPSRDLRNVQPAAIAVGPQTLGDRGWGPRGLRVGMLAINQLSAGPTSASHGAFVNAIGLTYYHQLIETDVEEELVPNSPTFKGGFVLWGDDQSTTVSHAFERVEHQYAAAGTYDVSLSLIWADTPGLAWSGYPSAVRRVTVT